MPFQSTIEKVIIDNLSWRARCSVVYRVLTGHHSSHPNPEDSVSKGLQ